jgi:NTP pyrophosphatase (non-canonical NTP hydrolase)
MTFNEYIPLAIRTESPSTPLKSNSRIAHAIIGLNTEINEIYDALEDNTKPLDIVNILEEIGDLYWYIAIMYDTLNISVKDTQKDDTQKYADIFSKIRKYSNNMLDLLKKHMFYNKVLDINTIIENTCDIKDLLDIACVSFNSTPSQVMTKNINKLSARYPEAFSEYLAENRNLSAERAILEQ